MARLWLAATCAVALTVLACNAAEQGPRPLPRRWLFVMRSMSQPQNLKRTLELLPRAKAAGYNALVLSDNGLMQPHSTDGYAESLRTLQREAKKNGLDLIPCVMPIGYSGVIIGQDPNLAEGLPVKDALFVVSVGKATLVPDPAVTVSNGDLEKVQGDTFPGWSQENAGKSIFADHQVVHRGQTAVRMERIAEAEPKWGHCRFIQTVKVHPFRQYRLRAWVKTEKFSNPSRARVLVLAPTDVERTLADIPISQETQDWTGIDTAFNTLEWNEVRLYFGSWGGGEGKIWWDDISLEEVGLVNVLRRAGTPLTVKSETGRVYKEGVDYEPIQDARLAPWDKHYHVPPAITLTPGSAIQEGERLRVSYYHPVLIHEYSLMCCVSQPKLYHLLAKQIKWVNDVLHPDHFFMQHDEIRTMNWDDACQRRKLTPGQLLADNARQCVQIIKTISPKAKVWVWSDMFDPMHNAVKEYYLVNGPLTGSWEGLGKDVGIVNWAGHLEGKNAKFFADRGHEQVLAGYYDGDEDGRGITRWLANTKDVPRVTGAMYTTWQDKYDALAPWAKAAWGGAPRGN